MALPKIAAPRFKINLPSNKQEISFRPLLVKEEKILLMAVEANDESSMITAVTDVVAACIDKEGINVSSLPYFDIEYLFLNIRAKSIGEMLKLEYRHTQGVNYKGDQCDVVTKLEINLETVDVTVLEDHKHKIQLSDDMYIQMKYPTIEDIKSLAKSDKELELIARCVGCVYVGDEVHDPDSLDDAREFIESLNSAQFDKLTKFFETMPKLRHELTYKCAGCGQEDKVSLEGIADFF